MPFRLRVSDTTRAEREGRAGKVKGQASGDEAAAEDREGDEDEDEEDDEEEGGRWVSSHIHTSMSKRPSSLACTSHVTCAAAWPDRGISQPCAPLLAGWYIVASA